MTVVPDLRPLPALSELTKTGGLLAVVIVHNLICPPGKWDGAWPAVLYAVYAGMFWAGTCGLTADWTLRMAATVTSVAAFAAGIATS